MKRKKKTIKENNKQKQKKRKHDTNLNLKTLCTLQVQNEGRVTNTRPRDTTRTEQCVPIHTQKK